MFLLPLNNVATRRILEGSSKCDLYTPPTAHEQAQMMEGFLRFIECWLNKIRRPNPNKNWVSKNNILRTATAKRSNSFSVLIASSRLATRVVFFY